MSEKRREVIIFCDSCDATAEGEYPGNWLRLQRPKNTPLDFCPDCISLLRRKIPQEKPAEQTPGEVYIVVWEERHSGSGLYLFSEQTRAKQYAALIVSKYYPEAIVKPVEGCLLHYRCSEEGDYVYVQSEIIDQEPTP